jgi:hypothetical protein
MKKYSIEIPSPWAPEDAFEYMARFSNAQEWDPGVLGAEDLDHGPPRLGSTYGLVVGVLGRRVPLEYRIAEIDRPRRVVLVAENAVIRSRDLIEVYGAPGGSKVVYEAALSTKGAGVVMSPMLGLALRHIGDRAAAGLRQVLGQRRP